MKNIIKREGHSILKGNSLGSEWVHTQLHTQIIHSSDAQYNTQESPQN